MPAPDPLSAKTTSRTIRPPVYLESFCGGIGLSLTQDAATSTKPRPEPMPLTKGLTVRQVLANERGSGGSTLRLLFAGVGDARHVYRTLADVAGQLAELDASREHSTEELTVNLVVNDHTPEILARSWVMLSLMYELGLAEHTLKTAQLDADAKAGREGDAAASDGKSSDSVARAHSRVDLLRAVLFETYLSPIATPLVDRVVKKTMQDHPIDGESPWGGRCGDGMTTDALTATFEDWRTNPLNVTPEDMHAYVEVDGRDYDPVGGLSRMSDNDNAQKQKALEETIVKAAAWPIDQLRTLLTQANVTFSASDDHGSLLEKATPVFASAMNVDQSRDPTEEHMLYGPILLDVNDTAYWEAAQCYKYYRMLSYPEWPDDIEEQVIGKKWSDTAGLFVRHVLPHMKPNVTFIHREFRDAQRCGKKQSGNPFTVMLDLLGGRAQLEREYETRPKPFLNPDPSVATEATHKALYQTLGPLFGAAGSAIFRLASAGGLDVQFFSGDMCGVGHQLQRAAEESPEPHGRSQFSAIFCSNVPDYTGMLPMFLSFAPLLEPQGLLLHNCLLNCSVWSSMDEYLHATTRIPRCDLTPNLLGVEFITGGIWAGEQICWQPSVTDKGPDSAKMLMEWLHDLFLAIVMPPKRAADQYIVEACPLTLDSFFRLLDHLHRSGRVPTHWIAEALQPLLGSSITTRAQAPIRSPTPPAKSPLLDLRRKAEVVDLRPFHTELVRLWGLWSDRLGLAVPTATVCPSSSGTATMSTVLAKSPGTGAATPMGMFRGERQLNCLPVCACAIVTHPSESVLRNLCAGFSAAAAAANSSGGGESIEQMMAQMMGLPPPPSMFPAGKQAVLTQQIMIEQCPGGALHLFSCFHWDHTTGRLSVTIPLEILTEWETANCWAAMFVYRTDSPGSGFRPPIVASLGSANSGVIKTTRQP